MEFEVVSSLVAPIFEPILVYPNVNTPPSDPTIPKLCLNMIVKNESKVMKRLLDSLVGVIDSFCICDTGSSDNTVELIVQFFEKHGIPGKVVREPFRDFGYNRSYALKQCETMENADYILLLDADMVFWKHPDLNVAEFKQKLSHDAYYMYQGSDSFFYKNVRVVKNRRNICYWGVTHEFVKTPEGSTYSHLDKSQVFIRDIGDGGAKADKFERDIRLLKKGLEEIPNNDRYTFYLANSYRDHGDYELAIETYKKRIQIGGWHEEVWYSYYSIGKCYKAMKNMEQAVYYWLEAYQFLPKRVENLYELVNHYRWSEKYQLAYMFCNTARKQVELNPNPDYLFLHKDVYDYKLDYEMTIIGYYCNLDRHDLGRMSMDVIKHSNIETSIFKNVLSNYKFYSKMLKDWALPFPARVKQQLVEVGNELLRADLANGFFQSTPSLVYNDQTQTITVCQRYVDYWINDKGGYENRAHITTKNVLATFDASQLYENLVKTAEWEMHYDRGLDNRYVGLEDVRLHLNANGAVMFNANRGIATHSMMIEHGCVDLITQQTQSGLILFDRQRIIEKNWVMFNDIHGNLKVVYEWNKLVIGNLIEDASKPADDETQSDPNETEMDEDTQQAHSLWLEKTHELDTPGFFKWVRGSTNGITIGNEIWFICHYVSYEDRRYYYHLFVVLDAETFHVKKYTPLFTFEKEKVEYTLGFVYLKPQNRFLIGYSKMDKQTDYIMVSKGAIDNMCISV